VIAARLTVNAPIGASTSAENPVHVMIGEIGGS